MTGSYGENGALQLVPPVDPVSLIRAGGTPGVLLAYYSAYGEYAKSFRGVESLGFTDSQVSEPETNPSMGSSVSTGRAKKRARWRARVRARKASQVSSVSDATTRTYSADTSPEREKVEGFCYKRMLKPDCPASAPTVTFGELLAIDSGQVLPFEQLKKLSVTRQRPGLYHIAEGPGVPLLTCLASVVISAGQSLFAVGSLGASLCGVRVSSPGLLAKAPLLSDSVGMQVLSEVVPASSVQDVVMPYVLAFPPNKREVIAGVSTSALLMPGTDPPDHHVRPCRVDQSSSWMLGPGSPGNSFLVDNDGTGLVVVPAGYALCLEDGFFGSVSSAVGVFFRGVGCRLHVKTCVTQQQRKPVHFFVGSKSIGRYLEGLLSTKVTAARFFRATSQLVLIQSSETSVDSSLREIGEEDSSAITDPLDHWASYRESRIQLKPKSFGVGNIYSWVDGCAIGTFRSTSYNMVVGEVLCFTGPLLTVGIHVTVSYRFVNKVAIGNVGDGEECSLHYSSCDNAYAMDGGGPSGSEGEFSDAF